MTIAVRPCTSRPTARSSRCSVAGSRRDEASSRITSPGSWRKMRIKASSCASPADSPPPPDSSTVSSPLGSDSSHSPSPSSWITWRILSSETRPSKKVRLSRTVAWKSWTFCVTMPTRPRRSASGTRRTSTNRPPSPRPTRPRSGIVETEQQPGQRRLAAAGAAQQAQHPARRQAERKDPGAPSPSRRRTRPGFRPATSAGPPSA